MNDFLSFRTNLHSVILNEVKNLYHKDPSLPLRMTKETEKLRMTKVTEKHRMTKVKEKLRMAKETEKHRMTKEEYELTIYL